MCHPFRGWHTVCVQMGWLVPALQEGVAPRESAIQRPENKSPTLVERIINIITFVICFDENMQDGKSFYGHFQVRRENFLRQMTYTFVWPLWRLAVHVEE